MSLQVRNLDYQIGGKSILEQICLEVKDGEFVGLIGPNGCGKSTLLKNIYRTYKPDRDTIFLNEKDVLDFSFKKMAAEMAVMAQENHVEFDFEVRDMVMFGRYAKKKFLEGDSATDKKLCEKCLREVGLTGYEHRSYLSLSGGEKQRVLLARVLMQESAFIVLDEPTNHLDVSYQYQIMDILKKQNVTLFSSIHDLNLASLYCDKIIFLYQGKIVDYGTPEEARQWSNSTTFSFLQTLPHTQCPISHLFIGIFRKCRQWSCPTAEPGFHFFSIEVRIMAFHNAPLHEDGCTASDKGCSIRSS